MKIELNLWFNKTNTNGQVNVNAGEALYKFNDLEHINKFVDKGIAKGIGDIEVFKQIIEQLDLDIDAKYAWLDSNDFVCWNTQQAYAKVFYNADMYTLSINKDYTRPNTKVAPHASFYYRK